jgi:hypothetical protein
VERLKISRKTSLLKKNFERALKINPKEGIMG